MKAVRITGRIKALNTKGFGFITADDGQEVTGDVFFHLKSLEQGLRFSSLSTGDAVICECVKNEKGWKSIATALTKRAS